MRPAREGDEVQLLGMFDEAVVWLVARGQEAQWGAEPWSGDEKGRETVRSMVHGGGLHLLERAGLVVGALDVGASPQYAKPVDVPELYIRLVLTSRACAGRGFGTLLIDYAEELARGRSAELLRVDCWAGAPTLVAWYERHGFACSDTFAIDGWQGQVAGANDFGVEFARAIGRRGVAHHLRGRRRRQWGPLAQIE